LSRTIERLYSEAVQMGDYTYQWRMLSNEIRRLQERQRTIKRAEARAEAEGIDRTIIDIAVGTEFVQNKKMIERLSEIREETKARVRAEKKKADVLPKVNTARALMMIQRQNAREEADKRLFRPSERNLSFRIQKATNEAIEELIRRMFFKGNFLKANYLLLQELDSQYKWVFDYLGFTLTNTFKSDVAKNYADYASDTAFDFFSEVVTEKLSEQPAKETYFKDGVEYIDEKFEHTVDEYQKAIRDIIAKLKPNL